MLDFIPDQNWRALLEVTLLLAGTFGLIAIAVMVLRKWRGSAADDQPSANELLMKFREMHSQGGLSDHEYRTIKTKLATQLDEQLKSDDRTS